MSTFIDGYPSVLTKSRSFIAPWLQITINRQKTQVETWRETPQFVPKISTKKEIFSIFVEKCPTILIGWSRMRRAGPPRSVNKSAR